MRSLFPLPIILTVASVRSISVISRLTSSASLRPEEYSNSNMALSLRAIGLVSFISSNFVIVSASKFSGNLFSDLGGRIP